MKKPNKLKKLSPICPPEFFFCSCFTHAIGVWHDRDNEFWDIEFSIWDLAYGGIKMPWKVRLYNIWKILTTGTDHTDQICLSRSTARRLGKRLIELANRPKSKKK
jgi:hypothetical protein